MQSHTTKMALHTSAAHTMLRHLLYHSIIGVDIQTYRARIGTNKFAFGSDVVTSSISVNFSLFLKSTTVSLFLVVMCLVLKSGAYEFSLIDAVDVANEKKAEQNLELQLPSIDAVRYIPALFGPLWNCLVLKQRIAGFTGAVLFIGLLLLRGGIEPNPGPIPEFPMVVGRTDKLKLTVKCGKLYEVQNACLLVDDAFQTHNQEVIRVPFPVWDDYKPYSATKVESFGNDLKNAVAKGLTQCEESPCSIAAFSPIVAVVSILCVIHSVAFTLIQHRYSVFPSTRWIIIQMEIFLETKHDIN
ncbi:hypothetical protein MAR_034661 [Mya arenaria]|uniref:Uncharacterized protein n=1 Tax=Mya arenaria TaxID=6604 RepID=A0ABY7EI69_MYAAR|nr:hypothetical protein MAR_034661 [Mya arenaria]